MATRLSPSLEAEKGHGVGIGWTQGWPFDPSEWSPELAWPLSVRIFGMMRRQDSQVKSVMRAVTLPVRRTRWSLDPNGASDTVVAQCRDDLGLPVVGETEDPRPLRGRGRLTWAEHLRMALLSLAYGHMFFEPVYDIRDGVAHLVKLAPRLPETLAKINVTRSGDLKSIEQYPTGIPGDTGPYIEIERDLPSGALGLVAYCHEREGGVWQGQSILREIYSEWLIKTKLKRVLAMSDERTGMGVPVAKAAEGMTQNQINDLVKLAQTYRAGESSGAAVPYGADIVLKGVEGTLPDIIDHIRYFDEQIAGVMLAQFLELGRTAHGSRALGASFIDFFILALQGIADEVAMTATVDIVEPLVDVNFGADEPAPRVVVAEIGEEHTLTAQALQQLIEARAIEPDDTLEEYLRENYRLPDADPATRREAPVPSGPFGQPAAAAAWRRQAGKVAAGSTPASSKTWAGWKLDRRLVNHYAPVIAQALAAAIDTKAVARTYKAHARSLVQADVSLRDAHAALHLTQAAAEPDDITTAKAYLAAEPMDLTDASAAMGDLYQAAYVAGAHAGRVSIGGVPAADWEAGIDWSNWTPGDLQSAATLIDNGGLRALLADADVTIRSIADNRLDSLAAALADGVANGDSIDTIAASLTDLLDDADRAGMIANTEVNRAMTTATLDTYATNGIEQKEFLTSDPCPECQENEDQGAIAIDDEFVNGDPPVHPNCQCALLPVVDTGTGQTEGEEA